MTTTDPMAVIAGQLGEIARLLKPISDLAERLNQEATGEDVETVDAYILGETKEGDPVLHLYPAHPKKQYRFCAVYPEKFDRLPFEIDPDAKMWEAGMAPPEKGLAIRKGYLVMVPPFRAVRIPTGKIVDGKPQYKFARALEAEGAPAAPQAPQAPPPPQAPPVQAQKPANGKPAQAPAGKPANGAQETGRTIAENAALKKAEQDAAIKFHEEANRLDLDTTTRAKIYKKAGGSYVAALKALDDYPPLPGKVPATLPGREDDDGPPWEDDDGSYECEKGHKWDPEQYGAECPTCAEEAARAAFESKKPAPAAKPQNPLAAPDMVSGDDVMSQIEAEVARIGTEAARRYLKAVQAPNVPLIAKTNALKTLQAM